MNCVFLTLNGVLTGPGPDGGELLRAARTPNLDDLAARGMVGGAFLLPEDMSLSEPDAVASAIQLSLLGCDPLKYQATAGPLEAAAREVPLEPRDLAFSCRLVGTDGEQVISASPVGLSDTDSRTLLEQVRERLGTRQLSLFPGAGNRHTLRWADSDADIHALHPTDAVGKSLKATFPVGSGAERLISLMWDSLELLDQHPLNRARRDAGEAPANMLWPFAPGRLPELPDFFRTYRRIATVLSDDALAVGAARLMGMRYAPLRVELTELTPRVLAALDAGAALVLADTPEESGGPASSDPDDPERRIWRAERFDRVVIGPLVEGLKSRETPFKILVQALPPEPRPGEPALFIVYNSLRERDGTLPFDGRALEDERLQVMDAQWLIARLMA